MNISEKLQSVRTWRNDFYLFNHRIVEPNFALEYFCNHANPFYDRTCVNQVIRMQKLSLNAQIEGIRYVHAKSIPQTHGFVHIIEKQEIKNGIPPKRLDLYYIVRGIVYRSATLFQVTQSRLYNCVHNLNESLTEICKRVTINPVTGGYQWMTNYNQHNESDGSHSQKKKTLRKNPKEMVSPYGKFVDDHIESHMRLIFEKEDDETPTDRFHSPNQE